MPETKDNLEKKATLTSRKTIKLNRKKRTTKRKKSAQTTKLPELDQFSEIVRPPEPYCTRSQYAAYDKEKQAHFKKPYPATRIDPEQDLLVHVDIVPVQTLVLLQPLE